MGQPGDQPCPWLAVAAVRVRALLIGAGLGVVIDLAAAWIWFSFVYDGETFPY